MTGAQPLFTVVTISFRNLAGLRLTADSLDAQSFLDREWRVVDGGSKDGTVDFLRSYPSPALRWSSEPDGGIFDAMRKGLEDARGRYVWFMNAGDVFAGPDALHAVADALAADPVDVLWGDALEAGEGVQVHKRARSRQANAYAMLTHHQAIAYRTEAARRVGFDLSYRWTADWVFTERMLQAAGLRVRHLPRPLCIFERGGVSMRDDHRREIDRELLRIYREEMGHGPLKAAALWTVKVGSNALRARAPALYDRLRYGGRTRP